MACNMTDVTNDITGHSASNDLKYYTNYPDGDAPTGDLPLAVWGDFTYAGGFAVPSDNPVSGASPAGRFRSSVNGVMALSSTAGNMLMVGNPGPGMADRVSFAEVTIPTLNASNVTVASLPVATFVQGFAEPDLGITTGGSDENDIISGMFSYDGKIIGTVAKYYDGGGDNTYFMWVMDDDLTNTKGYYTLTGYHSNGFEAAGWITPVPAEWQSAIGSAHIMGSASNWAITGRCSIGPSMFGIDLDDLTVSTPSSPISISEKMNFPFALSHSLSEAEYPSHGYDYLDFASNIVRQDNAYVAGAEVDYPDQGSALGNDIWTVKSLAAIGFIVPGSRTYAVFGTMVGAADGIGYKIVGSGDYDPTRTLASTYVSATQCYVVGDSASRYQDNDRVRVKIGGTYSYGYVDGNSVFGGVNTVINVKSLTLAAGLTEITDGSPAGGYAAYSTDDWSHFYWFFDLNTILAATNKNDIAPYAFGAIDTPLENADMAFGEIPEMRGGVFDPATGRLYLSLKEAGASLTPVVMAYDVSVT
ncbi:MAG: hypothetical protein GY941_15765 [Planctomycetes bacterium]|nr:hypothetical protein [Planctomycetota bacterium]